MKYSYVGSKYMHFMTANSDLHTSTSICPRTAQLSLKKFLDDKPVFYLEILQNIILKVFPYLDDGSVSDLLRSCPSVPVI
jgi:hypothetical protein